MNNIDIIDLIDKLTELQYKTQFLQTIPLLLHKLENSNDYIIDKVVDGGLMINNDIDKEFQNIIDNLNKNK